jgi:hypothetical protein
MEESRRIVSRPFPILYIGILWDDFNDARRQQGMENPENRPGREK